MYGEADMPARRRPPDAVRHEIDENIRRIYRQTVEEDIPDQLKELLARLRDQEADDGTS